MASRGRGRRGRPQGTGQAPPAIDQPSTFDQQAFTKAVGIAVAAIAQACAIVNQGRSSDIQRLEAHHPPLGKEGGVDDMQASRIWVLVLREREINLLLVRERSRRLLVRKGYKAPVIRARDELVLLVMMGRWCATIASSPDI